MKIVQISDCHLFADPNRQGYKQIAPYHSLARVFSHVKKKKPDLVIATGDISADKSAESYQHFISLWHDAGINCNCEVMAGNHDDLELMQEHFVEPCFGQNKSWLQGANWQVHILNSKYAQGTKGFVNETELQALQLSLSKTPELRHLIAVHHHPIECNGWMDRHEWLNRAEFMKVVAAHPQVNGVIYGHIHHASEQKIGACLFMSAPSTCWQWAMQAEFATSDELPGFRVIELSENGLINSEIWRV